MQSFISEGLPCLEKWPVPPSVSVSWKEEVSGGQGLDEGRSLSPSFPAVPLQACGTELGWRPSQAFSATAPVTSGVSFTCSMIQNCGPWHPPCSCWESKWVQPGSIDPTTAVRSKWEGVQLPGVSAQFYKALTPTGLARGNDHTLLPTDLL